MSDRKTNPHSVPMADISRTHARNGGSGLSLASHTPAAPVNPSTPPDTRLYAIGDIHGRADLLVKLLGEIERYDRANPPPKNQFLIFLGDYVDRGPESARVIDILMHHLPKRFRAICLKGNHEALFLAFLADPAAFEIWQYNGGLATLASYGCDVPAECDGPDPAPRCRKAIISRIPQADLRFLRTLRTSVTFGDYMFVHAGIKPGIPLDEQRETDLIWIRGEFLNHAGDLGKVVVHGHTPAPEPQVRDNRIGIDTAAWKTGHLTAVMLEGEQRLFLST